MYKTISFFLSSPIFLFFLPPPPSCTFRWHIFSVLYISVWFAHPCFSTSIVFAVKERNTDYHQVFSVMIVGQTTSVVCVILWFPVDRVSTASHEAETSAVWECLGIFPVSSRVWGQRSRSPEAQHTWETFTGSNYSSKPRVTVILPHKSHRGKITVTYSDADFAFINATTIA